MAKFGLGLKRGNRINGHVPCRVKKGEGPMRANKRALGIDGDFAAPFRAKTGISEYTLI